MKKEYIVEWIGLNKDMHQDGGLGTPMIGEQDPLFCGGMFL